MSDNPEALRQECADFATSLRSAYNVAGLKGKAPPSFLRAADLFERAAAALAQQAATPTDAREAFEAWLGREAFTERSDSGKYVSAHVDAMWSAWRAALAQQAATPTDAGLLAALEGLLAIHTEPAGYPGKFGKELDRFLDEQQKKIDAKVNAARAAIAAAHERQAATPAPAEPTVEALEYLFLAIATNADSDYRFRALRRAESALEKAMPGWTSPVPSVAAPPATPAAQPAETCDGPWKLVPMRDRSYDMRVKGLLAFNKTEGDRDDKLQAAWVAMVDAAPATPAPAEPLTDERIEFGLNCNLDDPSDDEAVAFFAGARFAQAVLAAPPATPAAQPEPQDDDALTVAYMAGRYDGRKAAAAQPADEREAFEAWAAPHGFELLRDAEGKYDADTTADAWLAWEARAALGSQG